MVVGPYETIDVYYGDKPTKEQRALFENGTTPIFTFFYNEPWKNTTPGPAGFLAEPEVHMTCVRTVPSAKGRGSGSTRSRVLNISAAAALIVLAAVGANAV